MRRGALTLATAAALVGASGPALAAQRDSDRDRAPAALGVSPPVALPARAWVLMLERSGQVIASSEGS